MTRCFRAANCVLSILCSLVCMQSRVSGVTINEFFSFGQGNGDSELSLGDDDRVAVPFLSTFLFYGKAYTSFLVHTNGLISLNTTVNVHPPRPLPLTGNQANNAVIAPFWADADTTLGRGTGNVYYRSTTNQSLLQRSSEIINATFTGPSNIFHPQYLYIVTWFQVGYYRDTQDLTGSTTTNTFQAVLVANAESSYVIFLYEEGGINWSAGDVDGGVNGIVPEGEQGSPATVGINAGDGVRAVNVTGTNTNNVINIENTTNIGVPGVWVFQVNGAEGLAPDPCSPNPCDPNADCQQIGVTSDFTCTCRASYTGNGTVCITAPDPCSPNPCDPNADCQQIGVTSDFTCTCRTSYTGNGTVCSAVLPVNPGPTQQPQESSSQLGIIIGGVVGGLAVLLMVVAAIVILSIVLMVSAKKRKQSRFTTKQEPDMIFSQNVVYGVRENQNVIDVNQNASYATSMELQTGEEEIYAEIDENHLYELDAEPANEENDYI